jgi:hypothetical protein
MPGGRYALVSSHFPITRQAAAVAGVVALLWSDEVAPQSLLSNDEISTEIENPVTRHITLPVRYQADFDDGAYQATKHTFEIDQAVRPFR